MKHFGLVVLAGVGLIQGGSASCCRTNKCLKAIVDAGPAGLAHCAAKLTVTVTGTAIPVQSTVTVVNSGVATSVYTVTTTDTALTQTLLFTESTTTTASTQTDVATTTTTTIVPSTDVSLAPAVTSTKTVYGQGVTARSLQTDVPEVPQYASGACNANFARYAKACACAGVKVVTVTAEPSIKTVTVEAGTVSIYSTYSSTETSTDLATASTSTTLTTVVSVTDTVTSTATEVTSSTTVVTVTTTPTSIVTATCKPPGDPFHVRVVQSNDPAGTTRYLNNPNGNTPAWQYGFQNNNDPLYSVNSHSWVINSDGYIETPYPPAGASEVAVPYIDLSTAGVGNTVQIPAKPKSVVEAGVRAGTYARVNACISLETNEFTISVAGRHNIFNCGNQLHMSAGDGSDKVNYNCLRLFPTAIPRTLFL